MCDLPVVKGVVGLGAAPGVDVDGVVAQGQADVVVPGGADAAQVAHPLQVLVEPHHPGDAPLSDDLINHVRLGNPDLRQGLSQVVEHNSDGPFSADILMQALAGEWVDVGVDRLRFGFRLHRGDDRNGRLLGRLGGGGPSRVLFPAGGQGEQQQSGQQQ